jgi:hypothetical protein
MPNDFVNFVYVSDDGNSYKIRILARIAGYASLGFSGSGGTGAATTQSDLPRGYRPRYVTVADPGSGMRRRYPVARANAIAWTAPLTSPLFVHDEADGSDIDGAIVGCHGEKRTLGMHAAPASS